MLVIGHFIGRKTELLDLSKQGKEAVVKFKHTVHYLGNYFAISHFLHALRVVLLCLLYSPSGLKQ